MTETPSEPRYSPVEIKVQGRLLRQSGYVTVAGMLDQGADETERADRAEAALVLLRQEFSAVFEAKNREIKRLLEAGGE